MLILAAACSLLWQACGQKQNEEKDLQSLCDGLMIAPSWTEASSENIKLTDPALMEPLKKLRHLMWPLTGNERDRFHLTGVCPDYDALAEFDYFLKKYGRRFPGGVGIEYSVKNAMAGRGFVVSGNTQRNI